MGKRLHRACRNVTKENKEPRRRTTEQRNRTTNAAATEGRAVSRYDMKQHKSCHTLMTGSRERKDSRIHSQILWTTEGKKKKNRCDVWRRGGEGDGWKPAEWCGMHWQRWAFIHKSNNITRRVHQPTLGWQWKIFCRKPPLQLAKPTAYCSAPTYHGYDTQTAAVANNVALA